MSPASTRSSWRPRRGIRSCRRHSRKRSRCGAVRCPSCCPIRLTVGWPTNCARPRGYKSSARPGESHGRADDLVTSALSECGVQRLLRLGDRRQHFRPRFGELLLLGVGARPMDGPRQPGEFEESPTNLGDILEFAGLSQPRVDALAADALPLQHIPAQLGQGCHPVVDAHEATTGQLPDRKFDDLLRRRKPTVGRLRNTLHELLGVRRSIEQQGSRTDHQSLAMPARSGSAPVPPETRAAKALSTLSAPAVTTESRSAKPRAAKARSAKPRAAPTGTARKSASEHPCSPSVKATSRLAARQLVYQGPRYTSWRAASRLVALTEGEQGCSEADFRAVPVGAALGLADRALAARGLADLDSVVTAGADRVDKALAARVSGGTGADPGLAGIASAWRPGRPPCCSMDRRTPSRSCSVFLRRPTVGSRRRKRSSNLRSGSWPVVAS